MHPEIFSDSQQELLPFIAQFKRSFYLVGGTAIALYIGHRRSIAEADKIYGTLFSEKLFREQLAFHKDINYSEAIEYLIPNPPIEEELKEELIRIATDV